MEGQEQVWDGDTIRGYGVLLENISFKNVDDKLSLDLRVQIPTDHDHERIAGTRQIHYEIKFDVIEKYGDEKVEDAFKRVRLDYEVE